MRNIVPQRTMRNILAAIPSEWVPLTVNGRYCGQFDIIRGLLELQYRGNTELYDLVEMAKSHADQNKLDLDSESVV